MPSVKPVAHIGVPSLHPPSESNSVSCSRTLWQAASGDSGTQVPATMWDTWLSFGFLGSAWPNPALEYS